VDDCVRRLVHEAKMTATLPYRFLALRWQRRYVIVPVSSIVRIEACDDRVTVVADRPYPHHETLASVCARVAGDGFVRVHRSHAVNASAVGHVHPRAHGEYLLAMRDGSTVVTGRSFRLAVELAFGFAPRRTTASESPAATPAGAVGGGRR
jgi:DNA-binding LytR/AlgR family response regulator